MSKSDSPEPDVPDIERLFIEALPLIPGAVKYACQAFDPHCRPDEIEDLCQDILVLLIKDDYHHLRTFNHQSSLKTWLYKVARRYVGRYLQKQKIVISLYVVSADSLNYQPIQEERLIAEDERKALQAMMSKLTAQQQQLLELLLRGLSQAEIAQEMEIEPKVVYKRTSRLLKKFRQLRGRGT